MYNYLADVYIYKYIYIYISCNTQILPVYQCTDTSISRFADGELHHTHTQTQTHIHKAVFYNACWDI